MFREWPLIVVLLLCLPKLAFGQDTCTITGGTCTLSTLPVDLSGAGCTGAANICTGTDNDDTLEVDDLLVVSGGTVTCSGTLTWTTGGWTTISGGTVAWDEDCAITNGDARDLNHTAGSFTVLGMVLDGPETSSPGFNQTTEETDNYARLGEVIHCCDDTATTAEDCPEAGTGQTQFSCLCWPTAQYDTTPAGYDGEIYYDDWHAALTETSSVVFFDPTTDKQPPHDVNSMYEITDITVGSSAQNCVRVDVKQSSNNPSAGDWATDALREVLQVSVTANQGERLLEIGTTTITADGQYRGRYLTCEDDQGNFPGWTVGISRTEDHANTASGNDEFLLDPPGMNESVSSRECYIDWGWLTGDPIFVMDPAEYTSTGTSTTDGDLTICDGATSTCSVQQLLVKDFAAYGYGDGTPGTLKNVWLYDTSLTSGNATLNIGTDQTSPFTGTIDRHFVSGSGVTDPDMHCTLTWTGATATVNDLHCRYHADDCLFTDQTNAGAITLKANRLRCSFTNGNGGTVNALDCAQQDDCIVTATDILSEAGQTNLGDHLLGCNGTCTYANIVSVGERGGAILDSVGTDGAGTFETSNMLSIGHQNCCTSSEGMLKTGNLTNAWFQDYSLNTNSALRRATTGVANANYGLEFKNIMVQSPRVSFGTIFDFRAGDVYENVAILDPQHKTGSGGTVDSVFYCDDGGDGVFTFRDITVANFPRTTTTFENVFGLFGCITANNSTLTLDGVVASNWDDNDSSNGTFMNATSADRFTTNVEWGDGPVLFNIERLTPSDATWWNTVSPTTTVRDQPIGVVNEWTGVLQPVSGGTIDTASSGAKGICLRNSWPYRVRFGKRTPRQNGHCWTDGGGGGGQDVIAY